MQPPSREELIQYLVRTGIAGHVDTPRHNNLKHYRRLAEGDPYYQFGLTFEGEWSFSDVLALMAKRCGVVADEDHRWGIDTIDPERTTDALEAVAERLAVAAEARQRALFATGHPGNLLEMYRGWKDALAGRGCPIVTAATGHGYTITEERGSYERFVEWEREVGYVSDGVEPRHSHHPDGMRAILADLDERGEPWPELAVADHGFAGAAAESAIPTIGFADSNDPALFVAEAENRILVTVPLDDGYPRQHYRPLMAYVLGCAGLS